MKLNLSIVALAVAILLAPVTWHLSERHLSAGEDRVAGLEAEIARLSETLSGHEERISRLAERVDGLDSRTARRLLEDDAGRERRRGPEEPQDDGLKDAFAQVVLIANRRKVNDGLTVASSSFLQDFLGLPREELTDTCETVENEELKELLVLADVGPIRARLLRPVVTSLKTVFRNVEVYEPELYARIESAGSLCVRRVRGSETATSAHAYGLAVDLNIDGELDTLGDGKTQLGLTILADFFRQEGWIWGAGFGREDSMHFEVSREKLEQWRRLGQI
jgi:hypothetical protein